MNMFVAGMCLVSFLEDLGDRNYKTAIVTFIAGAINLYFALNP